MKKGFVFLFTALVGTNLMMAATLHVDLNSANPTAPYASRETAATNIQTAVNAAVAGDTIQVWDGHYLLASEISVTNAITIHSESGPDTTIVDGKGRVRGFNLGNIACVIEGLTITNGYSSGDGGGIYCYDTTPVVTNCTITGNSADCGGGMSGGTANHCTLIGNTAYWLGGGMDGGTANNCILSGNTATWGGGMYEGTANNCILSGNTATWGSGMNYGTANNCIVYGNTAFQGNELFSATVYFSCSPEVVHGVNGNITNAPVFVDAANGNYRLAAGSPCIDAGSNAYVVGSLDLDGLPRIAGGVVDMGAFEYQRACLSITLPAGACEGDGLLSAAGSVSIPLPTASNLVVNLVSSDVSEVVVSNSVTILAGETNEVFDLDIQDDGLLDGSRAISITASASNYVESVASLRVDDNESTGLSLILPETVAENATAVSGVVVSANAPAVDVSVQLISDYPGSIEGSVVTLPAGFRYAEFALAVVDNGLIDGDRAVAIETQVAGWQNATSIVSMIDDEPMILSLDLPESFSEGAGVQTNAGSVSVSGILANDLLVELVSSDADEMSVPSSVVIPAGASAALFEVVVGDDDECDGAALVAVTAQATGYESANDEIAMLDNEVHHLSIDGLSEEHSLLSPVSITVSAKSIDEYPVAGYATEINLSASGDRGGVEIVPGTLTNMVDGVATATVVFGTIGNGVALIVDGGGVSVTSGVFNIISPQIMISHEPLTNILVVAGESVSKALTVSNAGNAALEYTISGSEDPSLIAYYPFSGNATDESGNGHDGTVNGATLTQDRFGNADSAYLFDGVDDYIEVLDSTDLRLSGTDFSISAWFYETERNASALNTLLAKRNPHPAPRDGWFYGVTGRTFGGNIPGKLRYFVSSGDDSYCTGINIVSLGDWHHAVMTYEVGEETIRFYVDGVLDSVHPNMPTPNPTTSMNLFIGRDSRGEYNIFHGAIDDISIYNRALSEEQIQELYDPPADIDLDSGLVAHYPFNGSASDESNNGHDGIAMGELSFDTGIEGECAVFDGETAKIQVPHSDDLNLEGPFTISCWVNSSGTNPYGALLAKIQNNTPRNGYLFAANVPNVSSDLKMSLNWEWPTVFGAANSTNAVFDGEWHHVVSTYDNQSLVLYVDGEIEMQTAYTNGLTGNTMPLYIGWDPYYMTYQQRYFHGRIDEMRIYNRALSGLEIESLYNAEPSEAWLSAVPGSGIVSAGSGQGVNVVFDAGDLVAGDYVSSAITLVCNDPVSLTNVLVASMLVLPPAPVIDVEPAAEYGTSNTVSWSMVPGSVQYEVEMVETTNSTALQQSGWISGTNHTFTGLSIGSTYCYRVRASIIHNDTVYAGAWSDWTWSTQIPVVDGDGDGIPDVWEDEFFGRVGSADATSDHDGDGQSDLAEFIAGTNPTNSESLFELDGVSDSTNDCFIVSWEAEPGRVYSVWWAAALTNDYSLLETDIYYPQSSYTDEVYHVEDQGFYRVEVDLE